LLGAHPIALPLAADAQRADKVYRIGFLAQSAKYPAIVEDLRGALDEIGRIDGFTAEFEERWAEDRWQTLPALASELVALGVDVIVVSGDTPAVTAATRATRQIPIVFLWVSDPVGQGLVQSLSRPGGNITGLSILGSELEVKRLELLKQAAPKISRVAVLTNSGAGDLAEPLRLLRAAGQSLGLSLRVFDVPQRSDLPSTLNHVASADVDGILVQDDYMLNLLVHQVAAFALTQRLPLTAEGMVDGVLIAYRFDWDDQFRRASRLITRILKGEKPGDLPIEQPTKFTLMIDLKTASRLGLTIPPSLVLRADRVIQ
jgi:putative ABC transport system substrate-binding protein